MSVRQSATRKTILTVIARILFVLIIGIYIVKVSAFVIRQGEANAEQAPATLYEAFKPINSEFVLDVPTVYEPPEVVEIEAIYPVYEIAEVIAHYELPDETTAYESVEAPEFLLVNMGVFTLTSYCPCVRCTGIWSADHPSRQGTDFVQRTASGTIPTAGRTIAVDTQVIPHGTTVIINGREYIAEDTGSGVRGNWIDIFKDCHYEALQFGRQQAEVYIIINKGE